jgi:predicted N-formylglutamate amidohydrolase
MMKLVVTCEHGGNDIPPRYQSLFSNAPALYTHRGYDPGALAIYQHFAGEADACYFSTTSRLLVELNRSLHHPNLFSQFTKPLAQAEKLQILNDHYRPYRHKVEQGIIKYLAEGYAVCHISIHSFTPELHGEVRHCDVGLLYDPKRKDEQRLCKHWRDELRHLHPGLIVRFNYPYRGTADGFTTHLRRVHAHNYIGIELEVNQKISTEASRRSHVAPVLLKAFGAAKAALETNSPIR